jgi:hypothetical protein
MEYIGVAVLPVVFLLTSKTFWIYNSLKLFTFKLVHKLVHFGISLGVIGSSKVAILERKVGAFGYLTAINLTVGCRSIATGVLASPTVN